MEAFSIEIKGAGTREEIIEDLKSLIKVLKERDIKSLEEGLDIEDPALYTTTDTFEKYVGQTYEEYLKNQKK